MRNVKCTGNFGRETSRQEPRGNVLINERIILDSFKIFMYDSGKWMELTQNGV